MKSVNVVKTAGFCFGVKKAVNTVYDSLDKRPLYTYGPIIHNEEVVKDMEKKGVEVVNSLEELAQKEKGTVVIRSHGVSKQIYQGIEEQGFGIIDATCPFVKKIHRIVEEQGQEGREVIIIGDPKHPEVQAIEGWCMTPCTIIDTIDKAYKFAPISIEKLCIVSQTTFNYKKFEELVEIIQKKGYDITCLNTICNATEERQNETRKMAQTVDAMIVIGGKASSNTQKLYDISKEECKNTYYIQTLVDLDLSKLESISNVGITAGASTPNNIIEEVHKACRK